jgi:hypothetical protein
MTSQSCNVVTHCTWIAYMKCMSMLSDSPTLNRLYVVFPSYIDVGCYGRMYTVHLSYPVDRYQASKIKGLCIGWFLFANDVHQWKSAVCFLTMISSSVHCGCRYCCPLCFKFVCDMSSVWEQIDQEIVSTQMLESHINRCCSLLL